MKVNLNKMSLRAQSFIKNPQFFKESTYSDFQVVLDDHDRVLTVFHGKNPDDMEFILAEVVAKFSLNKTISELWKINFREIESFLRDENHRPAFEESIQEMESVLINVLICLIGFAVKAKLEKQHKWIISQRKNWKQLSLTAKNEWAQVLIRPLGWELVFCEDDVLTVANTPVGVGPEALCLLINVILSGEEINLPMKVVAV